MHLARRAWCRTYQTVFRIALPILPYTEPRILEHAEDVPAVLQKRSIQRVLIVTDPGIARLGLTAPLETALASKGIGVTVYAETRANPTVSNVEEAASLYRESACQAIIGFGGGSAMDCAKGVGARIAQPNKPINKMRGLLRVHRLLPLLIAVPTTAGTGSEVTLAAVITDDETHYKYPINDFVLIPRFAVHDPEFTRGLPASITGQTGMDALTHAVEAFIGRSTTPYTRKMARQAVQLIHDNLLEAYEYGDDMRARRNMLSAAGIRRALRLPAPMWDTFTPSRTVWAADTEFRTVWPTRSSCRTCFAFMVTPPPPCLPILLAWQALRRLTRRTVLRPRHLSIGSIA